MTHWSAPSSRAQQFIAAEPASQLRPNRRQESRRETMAEPEIYCPECSWWPRSEDRWECSRTDCGTVWNTFWTGGVCPGCSYQWKNTQCLRCMEMSPHKSWYHFPDPEEGEAVEKTREAHA